MRDGDIDYSSYTLRELEEALAGINGHTYPKNLANLRAAYRRLTATLPPAPATAPPEIDLLGEAPPQPKFDEHGRYLPNQIPLHDRLTYLGLSLLLLAYGTYGVWANDLYVPGRRSRGVHLHDRPAWVMYGAIMCACAVMLSVVLDHYDRRNNERGYRAFANAFTAIGWTCFGLSLLFDLILQSRA